jgi:hypothetical protein
MTDFIVNSVVKEQLTDQNVSSDFYDALDAEVSDPFDEESQRAADNERKPVQARDL